MDEQHLPPDEDAAAAAAADQAEGSIQIAPQAEDESDSPDSVIELGDTVVIKTERRGLIVGQVYYRDEDLISIKLQNGSNVLINFPLENGDFPEEDDDHGRILAYNIAKKRVLPSFVEQHNIQAGQLMDVFFPNGAYDANNVYKIGPVDPATDTIRVYDAEDKEDTISFNFRGIPRERPFRVIATRDPPQEDEAPAADAAANQAPGAAAAATTAQEQLEEAEAAESAELAGDRIDFKIIGSVKMPRIIEIQNVPSNEQVYSDLIQKADLISDLIKDLTDTKKKNPSELRKLRTMTEIFAALKNDLIRYSIDGTPIGRQMTSLRYLIQLFEKTDVPLGRPVLEVTQQFNILNGAPDSNGDVEFNTPKLNDSIMFRDYLNYLQLLKEQTNIRTSGMGSDPNEKEIHYWTWLKNLYELCLRPWTPTDAQARSNWIAKQDSEFFRKEVPTVKADEGAGESKEDVKLAGDDDYSDALGDDGLIRALVVDPLEEKKIISAIEKGKDVATGVEIVSVDLSVGRALGPLNRTDEKKKNYLLREGEYAPVKTFILFPLSLTPYLGNPRSGQIVRDMEYGQRPFMSMLELIAMKGGVSKDATSNSIFALDTKEKSRQNIELADYLRGIKFSGLGMGSFEFIMRQFGIHRFEYNAYTLPVILEKLATTQGTLLKHISNLRRNLRDFNEAGKTTVNDRLIGAPLEENSEQEIDIIQAIKSSPLLVQALDRFKNLSPRLSTNDIAQIIALYKAHPDLLIATLGNVPGIIAKEEMLAMRNNFAKTLENDTKRRNYERNKGAPPTPNKCPHVALLRDIKRISDDNERMTRMVDLITKTEYVGKRTENFIECSKCNQHLICLHELLQIKQFTNPREKDTIRKEIYLNFNGPLVSGYYQCRNCGQPISELDFDNNLEFDDEGRPMMGRAVLVDRDAVREEQLEQALTDPLKNEELNITFKDPMESDIYSISKLIAEKVGITINRNGYMRIVDGAKRIMAKQYNRAAYAKEISKVAEKDKTRSEKKAAKYPDFDVRCSRILICACASQVLLEIQTAIPIYKPRYFLSGCAPAGFGGYPLTGNKEHMQGINYIACAISSIRKGAKADTACEIPASAPKVTAWDLTGWRSVPNDKDRIEQISTLIANITEKHIVSDAAVQHLFQIKNKYLRDTFGANRDTGDIAKDQISPRFLPEQIYVPRDEVEAEAEAGAGAGAGAKGGASSNEENENEGYLNSNNGSGSNGNKSNGNNNYMSNSGNKAGNKSRSNIFEAPIVPEATRDPRILANLYIKAAHKQARQTAKVYLGSPFAETICCPSPITDPQLFWQSIPDMPKLPPRTIMPSRIGSRLTVLFKPRPLPSLLVDAPENLYYRVFLNICARGPREGFPHEFGFTNKCAHCELQLPASILLVKDYVEKTGLSKGDEKKERETRREQLMAAEREINTMLSTQGLEVNTESFQKLLDATHNAYSVESYKLPPADSQADLIVMTKLITLDPPPVPDWETDYTAFMQGIAKIKPNSEPSDYAELFNDWSTQLDESATVILKRITGDIGEFFMQKMYSQDHERFDIDSFIETMTTYFIVPFSRIINRMSIDANVFVQKSYELHPNDVETLKTKVLQANDIIRKDILDNFHTEQNAYALAKLDLFVKQISTACSILRTLNARNVRGGNYVLMYIAQYIIFKPLADMINPNVVPDELKGLASQKSFIDRSAPLLIQAVKKAMALFKTEYLALTPEDIKILLRVRAEKETDQFIKRINDMSENEKFVEMQNKLLRTGRYAIGGSEAIYKYDPEYAAREALERQAAGIADFRVVEGEEFAILYGDDQRQQGRLEQREAGYGDVTDFVDE